MSERWLSMTRLGLAAIFAIGLAGCDPFTRLDFSEQTAAPPGDRVAFETIRLTEGRAIGVIATPMQGDEKMDDDTTVVLASRNERVAGVAKSTTAHGFVVFGAAPGVTTFTVTVDGDVENDIPVEVLEAP